MEQVLGYTYTKPLVRIQQGPLDTGRSTLMYALRSRAGNVPRNICVLLACSCLRDAPRFNPDPSHSYAPGVTFYIQGSLRCWIQYTPPLQLGMHPLILDPRRASAPRWDGPPVQTHPEQPSDASRASNKAGATVIDTAPDWCGDSLPPPRPEVTFALIARAGRSQNTDGVTAASVMTLGVAVPTKLRMLRRVAAFSRCTGY